ncbi:hypothetical protein VTO73DRAFT_10362 [Trametes versicolor]
MRPAEWPALEDFATSSTLT